MFQFKGESFRSLPIYLEDKIDKMRKKVKIKNRTWKNIILKKSRKSGREFGNIIIIRCVQSKDARTATPTKLSWKILEKITKRLTTEIPEVNRVCYDLTPKPPATIEYI